MRTLFLLTFTSAVLVFLHFFIAPFPNLPRDVVFVNDNNINVWVADTKETRAQGLSGVPRLSSKQGMLFVFDTPVQNGFWMKDMKVSLDIIWLDSSKKVIHIEENVTPETYPETFYPDEPALYVLEIRAGLASELGLEEGDQVSF